MFWEEREDLKGVIFTVLWAKTQSGITKQEDNTQELFNPKI